MKHRHDCIFSAILGLQWGIAFQGLTQLLLGRDDTHKHKRAHHEKASSSFKKTPQAS
jgi:hypothetical protein